EGEGDPAGSAAPPVRPEPLLGAGRLACPDRDAGALAWRTRTVTAAAVATRSANTATPPAMGQASRISNPSCLACRITPGTLWAVRLAGQRSEASLKVRLTGCARRPANGPCRRRVTAVPARPGPRDGRAGAAGAGRGG